MEPAASSATSGGGHRRVGRYLRRHGLRLLGLAAVVAIFVVVLPRIADYGAVLDVISGLSGWWLAALGGAAILNVLTFGPPWMAALPGLSFLSALRVALASTAIANVAPGGDAIGIAFTFRILRSRGYDTARTALAVILFSVWNQFVNVLFPIAAVVLLAGEGESNDLLREAGLVGAAILVPAITALAIALRSDRGARRIGRLATRVANVVLRLVRRPPVEDQGERLSRFRAGSKDVIASRWPQLTLATLAGHLTVWFVLLVCLRAVGIDGGSVSVLESFAAWSLVRLLSAVPLTPGGLGVVELGLTGALVGFGGSQDKVVAAVLVYRFLTFLPPIPLGLLAAVSFRAIAAPTDEKALGVADRP